MYNAEIFNQNKLFLKFNGLRRGILPIGKEVKDYQNISVEETVFRSATEFLSRASFVYEILMSMENYNKIIVSEFNQIKDKLKLNTKQFLFQSPAVREYICLFMPFLNTLYILQDRIMPIISFMAKVEYDFPEKRKKRKKFERDLQTLPFYYREKDGILSKFPNPIQQIFLTYWTGNGKVIRTYRNINQHVYDLLTHAYFQVKPKEKFLVYFPDDPNTTPENFKYSKSSEAYVFLKKSFREFHFFVEKLADELGYSAERHSYEVSDLSHADLKRWPENSTIAVSIVKDKGMEIVRGKGFPTQLKIFMFER